MVEQSRVRAVRWRDLLQLNRFEILHEWGLSLPWLLASWFAAAHALYLPALACAFMFFLTGLRQAHNAHHYALGLSRPATEWVLFGLSLLMFSSMYAVQVNHLRHHRFCMGEEDVEGASARMPWWKALLTGPLFPLRLHHKALEVGDARQRRWIAAELTGIFGWVVLVFAVLEFSWLQFHVIAMAIGQCCTAFFAVWTVHHDCEREGLFARTIRNRTKAFLTYEMFYHMEHHLFPAVPTCKLPILAKRIDALAPELAGKKVF